MNLTPISSPSVNRLITIGVSHYCEKARWALDWLEIPYVEERRVPPFHRSITRRYGGSGVPVLVTKNGAYTDSTDILHYGDAIASNKRRLYPADPQLRCHVNDLETWFDVRLGVATRCWGYAQVIDDRQRIKQVWLQQRSGLEKLAFELTYPYLRRKVRDGYAATPEGAARSILKIQQIFDEVGKWLERGQSYLVGDRFTAADLTFAALAAPVLFPPEYGFQLTSMNQLPDKIAAIIQSFRETTAGDYALRIYREHRYSPREKLHKGQFELVGGRR
ncbi:MAG: glutathione S-transferase family protein [Leptolyngbyaceae cyanobacterium MO_188.B28]|nr:glutathione S-transferase family protein [Leptolyngbyaceae cyanobacterium MO_188.B28]